MGNNQNKPLRKAVSVPDTQNLSPDAKVLIREKSQSHMRLNQVSEKPSKLEKVDKKHKQQAQSLLQLPPTEAVFLPEFPLRGDLEELEFEIIDVIAKGAYGNVIKIQREDKKRIYAVKVLDKAQILQEGAIRQCKDEASIQSVAGSHPFIVKAYEYWQSRSSLYIVLDYVPHGDMFTLWTFHGAFPEQLVRLYIAEMAMVIVTRMQIQNEARADRVVEILDSEISNEKDYLHNASVIYRDIKMENILFNAKGNIQLTDFGLAKWLQGGEQTRTVCGTLQYMAPEVLAVYPYSHSADWWSVGILMYAMLAGRYPVDGVETHTKMAQKVFESDYLLPSNISDSAQDVINRLLTKSPHKRLCDINILQDLDFFQEIFFPDLIEQKLNPIDVVPEDFFPMTGMSWAPHLITEEEQQQFSQFDDSNESVSNEHRYSHLPHYCHKQVQQAQAQQSLDKHKPYPRQPEQPQHTLESEQSGFNLSRDHSSYVHNDQNQTKFVASSGQYSSQYSINRDISAGINDPRLAQASSTYSSNISPAEAPYSGLSQATAPQAGYSGTGNNIQHLQSYHNREDTGKNGGTGRDIVGFNRQSSSNSGGGDSRASNALGMAPVGIVYPSNSSGSSNNSGSGIRISPNSVYRAVEAPPTISLKSTAAGLSLSQTGHIQLQPSCSSMTSTSSTTSPGYNSQFSGYPTSPGYSSQHIGILTPPGSNYQSIGYKTSPGYISQPSSSPISPVNNSQSFNLLKSTENNLLPTGSSTSPGNNTQTSSKSTSPGYSSQPYNLTQPSIAISASDPKLQHKFTSSMSSSQNTGINPSAKGQHFDRTFKTLDGPPTITLPAFTQNSNQILREHYGMNFQQSFTSTGASYYSSSINSDNSAGYSNSRRLEEATVRLDNAPLMEAPQTQLSRLPARERSEVPFKPAPPPKPTVPVRPTPAPRKSLQGNTHNSQEFHRNQMDISGLHQGSGIAMRTNDSWKQQDSVAPADTSKANNSSYPPMDQSRNLHLPILPTSDSCRLKLGTKNNASSDPSEPESPISSTSLEHANFKWNLPANATPSFV